MNVKDLKEAIANLPDDMEVILQKDAEGNEYSPLEGIDPNAVYVPETAWHVAVFPVSWSAEDCCLDDDEWEKLKAGPKALILFPVN